MTNFSWYGYEAQVDLETTRSYYAHAPDWDCICGHCRNFVALARERQLPEELLAILDSLSIPPEKATYVCELYHDRDWREKGLLYQLQWRVAGEILSQPPEECGNGYGPQVKRPWGGVMLCHTDDNYAAPDFPEPWFAIDCTLYFPWVLDEPVDGPDFPDTKET